MTSCDTCRYRSGQSWPQCLRSVLTLHNETLNIWTHLLGFFFFLSLLLWDWVSPPIPNRVTWQVCYQSNRKIGMTFDTYRISQWSCSSLAATRSAWLCLHCSIPSPLTLRTPTSYVLWWISQGSWLPSLHPFSVVNYTKYNNVKLVWYLVQVFIMHSGATHPGVPSTCQQL